MQYLAKAGTVITRSLSIPSHTPRTMLYKHSRFPFLPIPTLSAPLPTLQPLSSPPFLAQPVLHRVPYIAPSIPSPHRAASRLPISYPLVTPNPLPLSLSISKAPSPPHHHTTPTYCVFQQATKSEAGSEAGAGAESGHETGSLLVRTSYTQLRRTEHSPSTSTLPSTITTTPTQTPPRIIAQGQSYNASSTSTTRTHIHDTTTAQTHSSPWIWRLRQRGRSVPASTLIVSYTPKGKKDICLSAEPCLPTCL